MIGPRIEIRVGELRYLTPSSSRLVPGCETVQLHQAPGQ
jgi:hypothetical protein